MKPIDQDQLIAYVLGDLSEAETQELEELIRQAPDVQTELAELRLVLGQLDQIPEIEPSAASRDAFYQFLAAEARQQDAKGDASTNFTFWRAVAAVALLLIGSAFGIVWQNHNHQQEQIRQLSSEIVETRKLLLLAMLEGPSASERIKAINVSTQQFRSDQQIAAALIDRLEKDENVNVRLKAAESLGAFMHLEGIVEVVIGLLELESSPEVQIMLIESLVNGQHQEALPGLRRLLEREDIAPVVRDLAAFGLKAMS